ncbi:putative glycoside hydrolase [Candidatus Promineifilum breve]|uniref:Glycoside hydrolase n=1 Tax=Candidatus Promineifilum breve TaxID=1806508 RepID=A0A160T823_9CHLR|nr:putative glycoside hydrolase [Candidatus Promineifilum breve]
MSTLHAIIFDLDGVITDTAEYHYHAWQRLADEEGLTFDREANERCRGVTRRDSLMVVLGGRPESEERLQDMMARKQSYYEALLDQIGPADLLPGVADLLDQLDAAAIPYAIASASKNAPAVCARLGIADRLGMLADGYSVERQKPYPDLFRFAAAGLGVPAARCLVVEDAAAGVEAALAAGMAALALGPAERFADLPDGARVTRRDDLDGVALDDLRAAAEFDPGWFVVQDGFDPTTQHHMETVFTLGNGWFAARGSFEEGYPGESAATFAHGLWDDMPISFTELVNLPHWLHLTISIDGDEFRLDRGEVVDFRRHTDLRRGLLCRDVTWRAPNGKVIDLHFERFHAYHRERVGAIRLLATAVSHPCAIAIRAGLDGHVANENLLHWRLGEQGKGPNGAVWLRARTRHTGHELAVAASLSAELSAGHAPAPAADGCPGFPALALAADLAPGQTLQVDKLVAFAAGRDRPTAAGDDWHLFENALGDLNNLTYDRLRDDHAAAWGRVWQRGDVVIEGDDEAQLALRFNLFQLLVAAPQHDERVSIGAKTLSGYGYRGHVFWDTEIFILPYLIYTNPRLARNMLLYRYHGLPGARRKAQGNGYSGAQFPWESAETGDEVTPRWVPHFSDPTRLVRIWTGDIQIHITADVAYAVMQYWRVTGDDDFMRDYGAEMILDGARFWAARAEPETDENGATTYAIRDVIGPDEYHEHVDNNAFTNFMARWHLLTALEVFDWLQTTHPAAAVDLADRLQLAADTPAHWKNVAGGIRFLHNPDTGLIDQFEGFFDREPVDPELFRTADRSLQVIFGIEGANERQVLKQADVIMLLCLFRDAFDRRAWQTNWDAYMPITDHRFGSSLGPSFHAWAACEMDRPEEAYAHFMLAARADLRNPRGNAGDGIHAASTGGVWQAAVFGFAGLRHAAEGHSVRPRLPRHWRRLAFTYAYHDTIYSVDIARGEGGEYRVRHEPQ